MKLTERNQLPHAKRIVIKIGSSSLTHEGGLLNLSKLDHVARVLSDLQNSGKEIILVSSGAVAAGRGRLKLKEKPKTIPEKQAVASVGQCELMSLYDRFFSEYGHCVSQILLTRSVLEDVKLKENAVNTFKTLFDYQVIPIINENDTIAVEEIVYGDNDTLSAVTACLIEADLLIVLSDIDGYYDKNPHLYPDAVLVDEVTEINDEIRSSASGSLSSVGTGGMATKINAAEIVLRQHIPMIIVSGEKPEILYEVLEGSHVGTMFVNRGNSSESQ